MMPNRSGCDLHIPHQAILPADVEDPARLANMLSTNFRVIQRWAEHLLRGCLTRVGVMVAQRSAGYTSSTTHADVELVQITDGQVGSAVDINAGNIRFLQTGSYLIVGVSQFGEGGGDSADCEFVIVEVTSGITFYSPYEARGEYTNGNGLTLDMSGLAIVTDVNAELQASVQANSSSLGTVQNHTVVTVVGPF